MSQYCWFQYSQLISEDFHLMQSNNYWGMDYTIIILWQWGCVLCVAETQTQFLFDYV